MVTRTDGGFLEGKKKVASRKAVYGLDVGIDFLLAQLKKNPEEEKSKNGVK